MLALQATHACDAQHNPKKALLTQFRCQLATTTGMRWFNVNAYTIGYTRDLGTFHGAQTGLGANVSLHGIPDSIKPYYGDHPLGVNVYLRIRLS